MALREIIDIEKSGFGDIYEANKRALEEERLETERVEKEKRREREMREKERLEKERERIEREKKAKEVKVRVDTALKKERLDGGIPKTRFDEGRSKIRRESDGMNRRSREVSQTSSTRRSREVLDGRVGRSRSNSPNMPFNWAGSREVLRNPNSSIKVRVDNIRGRSRSRSPERFFNDQMGFQDRFGRPEDRPSSFDGIPICEFNTQVEFPDPEDSFNNVSRNLSMREPFRGNSPGVRIWDGPPQQQQPRYNDLPDERQHMPFESPNMSRQSVFDGRLEPRPILRNPDPPELSDAGRLLQPSPFFRKPDEPRRGHDGSAPYEVEREFERFEQEVQELNRECIQAQEVRLREALEQEERMRYGRDDLRNRISDVVVRDDRRRPLDEPLSPQIAEKLRRLDEEALRLDLKRVTRLQNFDPASSARQRDAIEFDEETRRDVPILGRDFGDDRDSPLTREQMQNRSRDMEEFERKFLMERGNDRQRMPSRDRMVNPGRFDDGPPPQQQQRRDDAPPQRFIEEIPFGREMSEPMRPLSPLNKRQSMNFPADRSFDQKNVQRPDNRDFNAQNDGFGRRNMDRPDRDFMRGNNSNNNNNNFGPRDSPSFSDMRNNVPRNPQAMAQFGPGSGGPGPGSGPQGSYQNMNQRGPFNNNGNNNNNNFGPPNQGPNQFRGDFQPQQQQQQMMMNQQHQRGMDAPWNNMINNRDNRSPPKQFPQQQWMNQENPNFNPNNDRQMSNQFPNQMFGGNNNNGGPGGHFQGGGPGMQQQFPNDNQGIMNMLQNQIGQSMMGMFQNNNNNNMQRGGPGNMQGMMGDHGRQDGGPPGNRQQNSQNSRRRRYH